MIETKRQHYEVLRAQLDLEFQARVPLYRDIADHLLPWRPQFTVTEHKNPDRRSHKIYDGTATLAHRTCEAGMMGGLSSPARPWFELAPENSLLTNIHSVKAWTEEVTESMAGVFLRSNLYPSLSTLYGDLSGFGIGGLFIEEDFDTVIHLTDLPIGSYRIGSSGRGKVDILFRCFPMTVRQLVDKFGRGDEGQARDGDIDWNKFSIHIKNLWMRGQREQEIEVCHVILPNKDRGGENPTWLQESRYHSCYYERGGLGQGGSNYLSRGVDDDRYLREEGYDYFPALIPRWKLSGGELYASSSPGMEALGDIKQLQIGEKRSLQAIEKMINPPMQGPIALKQAKASIMPGDITYLDTREGTQGFRPAHEVRFSLQELEIKQEQVRQRIRRAFYEDLFLMLAQTDRRQITAREIEERHEEKLLVLGPVLERLNQDLFDPLIDLTFSFMLKQGLVPEPPEELQGQNLRVNYISILAQAQKLAGVANLERFHQFVVAAAPIYPEIVDKVLPDKLCEHYGDKMSVPTDIFRDDDEVKAIREERQARVQAEQQAAVAAQSAQAAKTLSETETTGSNALSRLIDQSQAGKLY